jgi:hypothetical protein
MRWDILRSVSVSKRLLLPHCDYGTQIPTTRDTWIPVIRQKIWQKRLIEIYIPVLIPCATDVIILLIDYKLEVWNALW